MRWRVAASPGSISQVGRMVKIDANDAGEAMPPPWLWRPRFATHAGWMAGPSWPPGVRSMSEGGGFQKVRGENAGEKRPQELGQVDKKAKMGIAFTCMACETRVTRFFAKHSYERGVVIIKLEEKDGCTVRWAAK